MPRQSVGEEIFCKERTKLRQKLREFLDRHNDVINKQSNTMLAMCMGAQHIKTCATNMPVIITFFWFEHCAASWTVCGDGRMRSCGARSNFGSVIARKRRNDSERGINGCHNAARRFGHVLYRKGVGVFVERLDARCLLCTECKHNFGKYIE